MMLDRINLRKKADAEKKTQLTESRVKGTSPSLSPEEHTGVYGGEMFGEATVRWEDGNLFVQFEPAPMFLGTLRHWHFDTFEITFEKFPSLPPGFCTFVLDHNGKVAEMKIDVPNPDFDFTELEFKKAK
jgi:hypothetical protein